MAPASGMRESFWNQVTDVAYGPTLSEVGELYVYWDDADFTVRATVVAERGAPVVKAFECESRGASLPAVARRLPSDVIVIEAVRRFGLGGIAPLIRLLGEESEFESRYETVDVADGESVLEAALTEHARLIVRRPRAQISRQIQEANRMRREGMTTAEIERELRRRFGVSRRTAYRRIREATGSLPEGEPRA